MLRAELPEAIGVSVLCPGLVDTELYLFKRAGPLPQDSEPVLAFVGEVMAHGMPAAEVGHAAVDGVERGEFLIVTHAASWPAAKRRSDEIEAAFATQAPATLYEKRYEVNTVFGKGATLAVLASPPIVGDAAERLIAGAKTAVRC